MTFEQILKDLKNKIYKPVYLLMGEETYFIDEITNYITANVLTESEKSFNQTVVYGKDADAENIISGCKRYPMMSNYQVFVVKEAQSLKNIELLTHYVESPLESTILVIAHKYKKLDKRKKLYKLCKSAGVIFESNKLYDDKIPSWIESYVRTKNRGINPASSLLLTEFLGNNLSKIVNEIDKLILTLEEGEKEITAAHIERNIGISKDFNVFELTKALGVRDVLKCNRIIDYFSKNPSGLNHITPTISMLFNYFSKLILYHKIPNKSDRRNVASILGVNPFFVTDYQNAARNYTLGKLVRIISYLRDYDMKSKGVGSASPDTGGLLKELIYKILH